MTLPERQPFFREYTREQFELAYELVYVQWRNALEPSKKSHLLKQTVDYLEIGKTEKNRGSAPHGLQIFTKLAQALGSDLALAKFLISLLIEFPPDAREAREKIELEENRSVAIINSKKLLRDKRRDRELQLSREVDAYIDFWQQNNLLPPKSRHNRDEDAVLQQGLYQIASLIIRKEVIQDARKFAAWIRQVFDEYGHVFMFPNRFSALVSCLRQLGNSLEQSTYDYPNYALKASSAAEAFEILRKFTWTWEEALLISTYFGIGPESLSDGTFRDLVHSVMNNENSSDRLRRRLIARFVEPTNSTEFAEYSDENLEELLKDPDIYEASIIVAELLRRGHDAGEIAERANFHWRSDNFEYIEMEAKARLGDLSELQKILDSRNKLGPNKKFRKASGSEIFDIVVSALPDPSDTRFRKIAWMELEKQEPLLLLHAFGSEKTTVADKVEIGKKLQDISWIELLYEAIESKPELVVEKGLQEIYLETAIKIRKAPKLLRETNFSNREEFERALNCMSMFGTQEDTWQLCLANREHLSSLLETVQWQLWFSQRSDWLVFQVYKISGTESPQLLRKAGLHSQKEDVPALTDLKKRILDLWKKSKEPKYASSYVELSQLLGDIETELLEQVLTTASFEIGGRAAAELGLRQLVSGDRLKAQEIVEKFFRTNLECALILYRSSRRIDALEAIADLTTEDSTEAIRIRWDSFPNEKLAPPTELDDPEYLLDRELEIERVRNARQRKKKEGWVKETWACRRKAHNPKAVCLRHEGNYEYDAMNSLPIEESRNFHEFDWKLSGRYSSRFRDTSEKSTHRWQREAINAWVDHGRQGIVEAVTGSGKSHMASLAIAEALDEGFAVLLLVPTRALADQWTQDNLRTYLNAGRLNRIGNSSPLIPTPTASMAKYGHLTVAVKSGSAVQQVQEWAKLAPSDCRLMLVIDEVHNISGKFLRFLLPKFERRLGLTATLIPHEYDNTLLKNYFSGDPVYSYEFGQAIKDGVVSGFQVTMLGVEVSEKEKTAYDMAFKNRERARIFLLDVIKKEIEYSKLYEYAEELIEKGIYVEAAKKFIEATDELDRVGLGEDLSSATGALGMIAPVIRRTRKTAIFADTEKNAMTVEKILADHHQVRLSVVTGKTIGERRKSIFRQLDEHNEIDAIAAPRVLDEGIDLRTLTIGCFVGRIRNRRVLTQRLGRILRRHPDKKIAHAIIIYLIGSDDDPNLPGGINSNLERSAFSFFGIHANSIDSFVVGHQKEQLREHLSRL